MRVLAVLLASVLLVGCGVLASEEDGVMCGVATALATARGLTREASVKDAGGDADGAVALAGEARSIAQQAHDRLETITSDEVHASPTWQALLSGYFHVAQAADALVPGYENTHGLTDEELVAATRELATAAEKLPARCFRVSDNPSENTIRS